jgi:large subunit ribosomal protein L14e
MSKLPTLPEIGRIVEITRGRDRGLFCVVVGHEADRFVYVADGDKRKAERPKKKNVLHIRTTPHIAQVVLDEIAAHGKVTNAKLRHAIRQFESECRGTEEALAEGGVQNGER